MFPENVFYPSIISSRIMSVWGDKSQKDVFPVRLGLGAAGLDTGLSVSVTQPHKFKKRI